MPQAFLIPVGGRAQGRGGRAVDLEDVKFHQCVRLTQFDEARQIVFTPPDGEFELMSYRLSQLELTPPFWVDCQVCGNRRLRPVLMTYCPSWLKLAPPFWVDCRLCGTPLAAWPRAPGVRAAVGLD